MYVGDRVMQPQDKGGPFFPGRLTGSSRTTKESKTQRSKNGGGGKGRIEEKKKAGPIHSNRRSQHQKSETLSEKKKHQPQGRTWGGLHKFQLVGHPRNNQARIGSKKQIKRRRNHCERGRFVRGLGPKQLNGEAQAKDPESW